VCAPGEQYSCAKGTSYVSAVCCFALLAGTPPKLFSLLFTRSAKSAGDPGITAETSPCSLFPSDESVPFVRNAQRYTKSLLLKIHSRDVSSGLSK
jgi:hypothetical protein